MKGFFLAFVLIGGMASLDMLAILVLAGENPLEALVRDWHTLLSTGNG